MERLIRTSGIVLTTIVLALAGTSAAGVIYYTAETADYSHLYSYDLQTGQITDRGAVSGQRYITDLATDAAGNLYGVGWADAYASSSSRLYQLTPGDQNQSAGWGTETVKNNNMDRTVNAAVFGPNGDLYVASATGSFQELTYDAGHDQWNVVKTGSLGRNAGGDLAFSTDNSRLYVALDGGLLGTVNFDANSASFGSATVIGSTGYDEVVGLAAVDGVLYGMTNDSTNHDRSYLIQIAPNTAQATRLADLGCGVWGAAGGGSNVPVPEPSTVALIALGAMGLSFKRIGRARVR